jgi:hypothetical protein
MAKVEICCVGGTLNLGPWGGVPKKIVEH